MRTRRVACGAPPEQAPIQDRDRPGAGAPSALEQGSAETAATIGNVSALPPGVAQVTGPNGARRSAAIRRRHHDLETASVSISTTGEGNRIRSLVCFRCLTRSAKRDA
jgi:hypothetical protein